MAAQATSPARRNDARRRHGWRGGILGDTLKITGCADVIAHFGEGVVAAALKVF